MIKIQLLTVLIRIYSNTTKRSPYRVVMMMMVMMNSGEATHTQVSEVSSRCEETERERETRKNRCNYVTSGVFLAPPPTQRTNRKPLHENCRRSSLASVPAKTITTRAFFNHSVSRCQPFFTWIIPSHLIRFPARVLGLRRKNLGSFTTRYARDKSRLGKCGKLALGEVWKSKRGSVFFFYMQAELVV